ncbi:MAG: isoleucine--tRNA ligase [Candidatus Falkowbacteria bacterium]
MTKKQTQQTKKFRNPFPSMEEEVLNFWEKADIFRKSVDSPPASRGSKDDLKNKITPPPSPLLSKEGRYDDESQAKDYIFYDGPPFATGTPHYGHIVASVMKDVVPRYWTMQAYKVERKSGWDCHGLPIENIVEKELGFKSKKDIEKLGIEKFNETCRSKVLTYVDEWEKVIRRLGRWADMENAYKTMDLDYMESVWYVFKELYNKGLVYEGYKSMHICPRCETTLSQMEVSEGYKDIKDLSVTVKFKLEPGQKIGDFTTDNDTYILAWTTTPWTLIGNVALAVGEDVDYSLAQVDNEEQHIIASEQASKLANRFPQIIKKIKGKDLVGKKYKPLFDYYTKDKNLTNRENGWKIYAGDFVTTDEGTGIVHIAPAFGDDDMNLGKQENLPFIQHIGMDGRIKEEVKDFAGMEVKPADHVQKTDVKILKFLAKQNLIFDKKQYPHSYPHCWRCETPLLNYATSSWFVKVTDVKDKAIKLAKDINWTPKHIKDGRFGQWLEGARDWSISRQRFWASVIPIWQCDSNPVGTGHCPIQVIGSVAELEKLSGEKIDDLHKHVVDKITWSCKCGGTMTRIPDVLDTWFDSGSMPYAQMHYPFENEKKFEQNFPAEFIAEGTDQTRAWFYYLHVIATAIKAKPAFKNVIVNGIVAAEDGKKMSKRLNNYPDPMEIMEKHGADKLRYYLCSAPVMKAENLNFSEKDLIEQTRFFNILLNVLTFYKMFARDEKIEDLEKKDLVNVLDIWITSRLEETKKIVTEKMNNYDLHAIREIPVFIDDLSTWYVRRSRDRFKGEDEIDKMRALKTLRRTLYHLARMMAPFMPFMAEHIYQELGADVESVHLEAWPEQKNKKTKKQENNVLDEMVIVRKIVELGLAKRDESEIKVRQPLTSLQVTSNKLQDDYVELIKDEVNVKTVEFKDGEKLSVELNTTLTPALKQEGIKRELVRAINNARKNAGMTIQNRAVIYYQTDSDDIKKVFAKFGEDIKKDTLADDLRTGNGETIKINGEEVELKVKKI